MYNYYIITAKTVYNGRFLTLVNGFWHGSQKLHIATANTLHAAKSTAVQPPLQYEIWEENYTYILFTALSVYSQFHCKCV